MNLQIRKFLNKLLFYSTIILAIINTVLSLQCKDPLLRNCNCGYTVYDRERRFVVNCTDTGFRNTDMLENLPKQTEVLIFTGNNISELPWNVFGEFNNLTNLTIIDMSNNNIREIKGKSYHHVPNVKRLILNHNNLTISDDEDEHLHHPRVFSNFINLLELHLTDAFADNTDTALANDLHDIFVNSNLSLLNKLHLEQNEIRGFRDKNVFCDLPSLMDLYLADNYITGLTFNVKCLKKLRFLDLEHNNITKFTKSELAELDSLTYPIRNRQFILDICSNPLICGSSENRNLYSWLKSTNVTVRDKNNLWCLKGRNKVAVTLRKAFEDYNHNGHAAASKAITVVLIVLAIILLLLLVALAYLSKEKLSTRFKPLFDIMSRKVHYTTIESQDV